MTDASQLENPAMAEAEESHEERCARVVRDLEHAVKHNAPIPHAMIGEVRHLLGVGAPNPDPTVQG